MSNRVAIIEIIVALQDGCYNIKQLAKVSGFYEDTVSKYIKLLHSRKLIRIAEWHKYGNKHDQVPSYEWNHEGIKDEPKPAPKTRAEVARKYRENKASKVHAVISKGSLLI